MSQSKMAAAEGEKKFTMRHTFENVMNMKEGEALNGPIEKHFNIPWKIRIRRDRFRLDELKVFFDCLMSHENKDWSVDAHIDGKIVGKAATSDHKTYSITFYKEKIFAYHANYQWRNLTALLNDGRVEFEFTVTIEKAIGVQIFVPVRMFDDEAAKATSDVTLIVKDRKFHVLKMFLATHSTYFKALFFGNLAESGKAEIELKEIDPNDFQNFLEFLYLESSIEGHSVLGILHLADFFDSKTVVKRCQEFLMEKSELPLHRKFETAIKYNLDELKTKCISEMSSVADLRQIVPENSDDFDSKLWKELFLKLLSVAR